MKTKFPAQDLDCPDPAGCSVAVERLTGLAASGDLASARFAASRTWFRVYDARDGHTQPNPGFGDTRFAPFDALSDGHRVPTLYLAEDLESALLEASLHDVSEQQPRVIDEAFLLGTLHARVTPPHDLHLVDLRDAVLTARNLRRDNISSSSPEHYACTRTVARAIHAMPTSPDGILWHSRQAELTGRVPREVAVIFADRVPTERGSWTLADHRGALGSLLEGAGTLELDRLAEALEITVEVSHELDD